MSETIVTARIDGGGTTIALAGDAGRIPAIVYWGGSLAPDADLPTLFRALAFPVAHAGLDEPFAPSLFPEAGRGDYGTPALEAFSLGEDGARRWATQFSMTGMTWTPHDVTISAVDPACALSVSIHLALDQQTGILKAETQLSNQGRENLMVNFLSCPALPISPQDTKILSWHGRWCAEFTREDSAWHRGTRLWESRQGRTSHETFPGIVSATSSTSERSGTATAIHLAHSGNWRMVAEDIAPGSRRVLAGALYLPGELVLAPGASVTTPSVYAARSEDGFNGVSAQFHEWMRGTVLSPHSDGQARPVHFNSWEALYFDLNMPDLLALVEKAAEVGAERFVLDDGWFKARHHDKAGLGDWIVDRDKFPDGLAPLIDAVERAGMSFGLWIEPEMVNPDSDLYRADPDWVLGLAPYPLVTGRRQLVLDIAKPAVQDYLFGRIDALLSTHAISYLKWDMNRPFLLPAQDGKPAAQDQVSALYHLLAHIRAKHPKVVIESCASGGGRIDFGIAQYCHRFWLSDNNDTHDRWAMAREASYFFPPEIFGFHVGPSPSHTSGRRLDMEFRAFSAAVCGHMGLELDLRRLGADELDTVRRAIRYYKSWRDILHHGRFHRLDLPDDYLGNLILSADGSRFLVAITQRRTLAQSAPSAITLSGLDDDSTYRVVMAKDCHQPEPQARRYDSPLMMETGYHATGRVLTQAGFRLPPAWPDQLFILEGYRAD